MGIRQDYAAFLASFASSKFRSLWPAQEYVLQNYAANFVESKDVAVELPTGAGKTGLHPFYQTTGQVKSPNLRGIL